MSKEVTPEEVSMKCTKHRNCKVHLGTHMVTVQSEVTTFDFKRGTITTRNMLDHTHESLPSSDGPQVSEGALS